MGTRPSVTNYVLCYILKQEYLMIQKEQRKIRNSYKDVHLWYRKHDVGDVASI